MQSFETFAATQTNLNGAGAAASSNQTFERTYTPNALRLMPASRSATFPRKSRPAHSVAGLDLSVGRETICVHSL